VYDALAPLRAAFPRARWVAPNKMHLTLAFLGPTDPAQVPAITQAMDGVARGHPAFEVGTADGGGRAKQWRGGVAWIRLGLGAHAVAKLALDLDGAIGSGTYDERHAPRPHLTVARGVSEEALVALRELSSARSSLTWQVDRVALLRSQTDPRGSRYEELAETRLVARRTS
jgi:2'-5' RNA ligase